MKLLFFDDFRLGVLKGVNVVDVSTATATARIAPVAIDCSTGVLIR